MFLIYSRKLYSRQVVLRGSGLYRSTQPSIQKAEALPQTQKARCSWGSNRHLSSSLKGWTLIAWRGKLRRPGAANFFPLPPQCILLEQGCPHIQIWQSGTGVLPWRKGKPQWQGALQLRENGLNWNWEWRTPCLRALLKNNTDLSGGQLRSGPALLPRAKEQSSQKFNGEDQGKGQSSRGVLGQNQLGVGKAVQIQSAAPTQSQQDMGNTESTPQAGHRFINTGEKTHRYKGLKSNLWPNRMNDKLL